MGAAYLRQGRPDDAERHFKRALKSFDSRVANGADDPFTRYYVACLYALRGDRDRALDSLERVAGKLPKLTASRARADVDLETLRDDPRFRAYCSATCAPTFELLTWAQAPRVSARAHLGRCRRTVLIALRSAAQCRLAGYATTRRHAAARVLATGRRDSSDTQPYNSAMSAAADATCNDRARHCDARRRSVAVSRTVIAQACVTTSQIDASRT